MSAAGPSSQADIDTALRVVVTPSQASFFAGEPLSVSITITNIRSPESLSSQRAPPQHTHKRSAHSVSSAPLARPPTSPGLLRAASTSVQKSSTPKDVPVRRGLVGRGRTASPKGADVLPEVTKDGKRRLTAKSLSVHVLSPHDLAEELREEAKSRVLSAVQRADDGRILTPSSPRISSPLARTPNLPPNHPHARKPSVLDAAPPDRTAAGPSTSTANPPIPQSASASTFAISLDPIAESASSPIPPTPNFPSPAPTPAPFAPPVPPKSAPLTHSYPPRPAPPSITPTTTAPRHPSQLGLGHGPPPGTTAAPPPHPPRSAFSSTFPPPLTELVLYAYVQLTGTLALAPPPAAARSPALAALRTRRYPRGGGSMDITSSLDGGAEPHAPRGHARSASLSAGLLGLLGSPAPGARRHKARSPSYVASFFAASSSYEAGQGAGVGLGLGVQEEEWDPETPLPVLEVPPAMLAVDLTLGPGESRTYTYAVDLPAYLPPTYKGRTLKFSYQLSVGTCRAGANAGAATPSGANSNSRVMKVPIRVYNHVAVDVPQMPYNLLAPTVMLRDRPQAKVTEDLSKALGGAVKSSRGMAAVPSPGVKTAKGSLGDLRAYAARLLASAEQLREDEINGVSPTAGDEQEREGEGTLKGCREAVEILTRVPKKISYDVNKDGVKVAVLTFTKSAYRLGETVLGVVELNERSSRARVLKLSAMLEAHESLPSSLSSASDARHMRRVHAEYHSSFVLSSLRTTFTLDIPSDASPAFQLTMGEPPLGGLEWKVRLCLLVAVAAPPAAGGKLKQLVRSGIRGEWGSSWVPTPSIAPLERPEEPKPKPKPAAAEQAPAPTSFWSTFFTSTFVAPTASGFHDGDDLDDEEDGEGRSLGEGEVDLGAGEEGWRPVRVETVECEVPVKVWPGNTAFRAVDVVFDV